MRRGLDISALLYLFGRFLRPYWKFTCLLVLLSVASASFMSLQPLVIAPALDSALGSDIPPADSLQGLDLNNVGATILSAAGVEPGGASFALILVTAIAYVSVAVVAAGLAFATHMLVVWIGSSVYRDLEVSLYDHLVGLSMSYFTRQRTGDVVSRFTSDALETTGSLDFAFRQMLQSTVQILFYGVLMVKTSPWLATTTVFVGVLHLAITRFLRARVRSRSQTRFSAIGDLSARLQESLLSIRVIKSFAAEVFESSRFSEVAHDLRSKTLHFAWGKHLETPLRQIADAVSIGTVLALAFLAQQSGSLTMSGFVLFVFLAKQMIVPVSTFGQSMIRLQVGLGAASRVMEVFNTEPDVPDGRREAPGLADVLRLDDVSFAYGDGDPVLREINLEIRKGETLAVVGPSGAGKSTLTDLVLRFYDPTMGSIRLDGVDVREFRQDSYRRLFGVVPQECLLFNASIADNIAYGRKGDREAVQEAAWVANAEEFIDRLPEGYDTLVGDRGVRLSGGQRQRIAIARAIFGNPQILILDEATSALDTESERLVQAAIDEILKRMTALVIAHRLSTIQEADRIAVLNQGSLEAVGPHEALLRESVTYRELADYQLRVTAS